MAVRPLPLLAALALVAGGCGDDEPAPAPATSPVASTPAATAPPPDATQPGTGPATVPSPAPAPAPGEPDAGDEEPIRVPATFVVRGGRLEPAMVTVPPFLAVEVSLRSDDGRPHRLVVRAPRPATLDVPAGGRAVLRLAGLRPGRYPLALDGRSAGALVAGGEAGP